MSIVVNYSPAQHAAMLQVELLEARRRGRCFSERNVLVILSEALLSGVQIDPEFQTLANAVMAKAIITGKLPPKQGGRPKGSFADGNLSYDAQAVAGEYFDLVDAGKKSEESIDQLAGRHNKDMRTIQRIVSEGRMWHGDSEAARNQKRREDAIRGDVDQPRVEQQEQDDRVELACMNMSEALAKLQAVIDPQAI